MNVLVGKLEGNRTLRKPYADMGDNTKTNLNEIACEGVNDAKRFSGQFGEQLVFTGQGDGWELKPNWTWWQKIKTISTVLAVQPVDSRCAD